MQEKRARAQALYSQRDQRQAQAGHAWSSGDRALAQRLSEEAVALSAEARAANDLAGKQIHSQKCAARSFADVLMSIPKLA